MSECPTCGGRGWHTAGGNDPAACNCPAGEAWASAEADLPHVGSSVRGTPDAVARAVAIDASMAEEEARWVKVLRAGGVRAAHPDDGWVDRERNTVHLMYPQFDDGVGAGSLLALGNADRWRLVRVTGRTRPGLLGSWRWTFDAIGTE